MGLGERRYFLSPKAAPQGNLQRIKKEVLRLTGEILLRLLFGSSLELRRQGIENWRSYGTSNTVYVIGPGD